MYLSSRLRVVCIVAATFFVSLGVRNRLTAQEQTAEDRYQRIALDRASKIVQTLKLEDANQSQRITRVIAQFYHDLHGLHEQRDSALKKLKGPVQGESPVSITEIRGSNTDEIRANVEAIQSKLHYSFIAKLEADLTPEKLNAVKDGITYNVVPITFKRYLELYPTLTAEQKLEIHSMLLEAREFAMDAGSSQEKHAWFGKYKGRINNYLSKAGYDAKEAERALKQRQNANSRD